MSDLLNPTMTVTAPVAAPSPATVSVAVVEPAHQVETAITTGASAFVAPETAPPVADATTAAPVAPLPASTEAPVPPTVNGESTVDARVELSVN